MMIYLRVPQEFRDNLYKDCLSPESIHEIYHDSCNHIADWTQAIDFGPYMQKQILDVDEEEPFSLGPIESNSISTYEFLELKKYQVN